MQCYTYYICVLDPEERQQQTRLPQGWTEEKEKIRPRLRGYGLYSCGPYNVIAYIVMAYVVIVSIVMASILMAYSTGI